MKPIATLIFNLFIVLMFFIQDDVYFNEIKKHREKENADFLDPDKSPLNNKDRLAFKGHDFYPIDPEYRVIADFVETPKAKPFPLATSRGTTKLYKKLGDLNFVLKGEKQSLEVYREVKRFSMPGAKTYLFLPVIDETSGRTNYGAGRYLHYEGIPEGTRWVVDFNKLYNPYCAYSEQYECPLVPEPNHLPVAIEAGVRGY